VACACQKVCLPGIGFQTTAIQLPLIPADLIDSQSTNQTIAISLKKMVCRLLSATLSLPNIPSCENPAVKTRMKNPQILFARITKNDFPNFDQTE